MGVWFQKNYFTFCPFKPNLKIFAVFKNAENPPDLVKIKRKVWPDPEANEEGNDGEKQEEENACLEC